MTLDRDLLELLELFRTNDVEFLVVGGLAVAFHGHPRHTDDLDLFVRPDAANGSKIVAALREFGFGSLEISAQDFEAHDRVIQLGVAPNRIDLLTRLYGVEFGEVWTARVDGEIDGVPVSFIDAVSLIRNKRATGRMQDLADVEALERMRPD